MTRVLPESLRKETLETLEAHKAELMDAARHCTLDADARGLRRKAYWVQQLIQKLDRLPETPAPQLPRERSR